MTVNLIESEAKHPAVSLIIADIVALDVAINSNVGHPGQNKPSYPPQSIVPTAFGARFVIILNETLSPPATVILGPISTVTRSGSVMIYVCVKEQPLPSETVNVYCPGPNEDNGLPPWGLTDH